MKTTKLILVLVTLLSSTHWGISQESNEIKAKKVASKDIEKPILSNKHEETLRKIDEIFYREGKEKLRISEIKKELGFKNNKPIRNIVEEDPQQRVEITKDGGAEVLKKVKLGLFDTTK